MKFRRIVRFLSAGSALFAAAMLIWAFVPSSVLVNISTAGWWSDAQAADHSYTSAQARSRAEKVADDYLAQTLAKDYNINGKPVRVQELISKNASFRPAARSVSSVAGITTVDKPRDLWVFSWELTGVPVPQWGIADGVVEVQVVFEDGSGKVRSITAGLKNPNPKSSD
jgi:hypothetical protein